MLDRRTVEARTLEAMVTIACHRRHGKGAHHRCPGCAQLLDYALTRLGRCPHWPAKPACRACPTPCYDRDQREAIRQVMVTAGPWMPFLHPVLSLRHLIRI